MDIIKYLERGETSMNAASAIVPVVFMLGLGYFTRVGRIISGEQNAGVKKLIFSLLLPILVFNATFTMDVDAKYIQVTGYMFLLHCLALALGAVIFRRLRTEYSHISPWLMTTIEGGNAFYPLYTSLVGAGFSSYFVLLDVPGIFVVFLVFPLVMARITSEKAGISGSLKSLVHNPVICGLVAGILLNVTGVAQVFMKTAAFEVYESLISVATAPIAPLILFTLGYAFGIGREDLFPMVITLVVRLVLMGLGIAGAFALFPWILEDMQLMIAVILFLMSPPAFAVPIVIEKMFRKKADGQFCSTYISMHMLVTVVVFAIIALIIG